MLLLLYYYHNWGVFLFVYYVTFKKFIDMFTLTVLVKSTGHKRVLCNF
jgi:hypothetical protein